MAIDRTDSNASSGKILVVTSVMFVFISFWRIAAVVLCDLASTAYYIGGIVEQAIGPAAPWFILAVMVFSYAVRSVYIESCSLFVRGGVYRVVKEAMGGFFAKLSVSALLFDYVLTGPISGVSAGQYVVGLLLDSVALVGPHSILTQPGTRDSIKRWGSVLIACLITVYFFRKNLVGIVESSGKALKIMVLTTVMGVVVIIWSAVTLASRGPANQVPFAPDFSKKIEYEVVAGADRVTGEKREMWKRDSTTSALIPKKDADGKMVPSINPLTGQQVDPLGFAGNSAVAAKLRSPAGVNWWSLVGLIGIIFAFGHSILAMSGEETLAQVYREVAAPKLLNFKKAAFIVFVYSLILTAGISFLAVLLVPNEIRMKEYSDNLIAGLAMHMVGPPWALILLHALVVLVGFLILAGAVNTAIVGSNGVLNRVAEDDVLPESLLKPHPHFGTTYRVLYLIAGLQLVTIFISRGNVLLLGEAYAFGVVWSFIFKALAMVILRFKMRQPRDYKVPLNLKIAGVEFPLGIALIFLVLLVTGIANIFSKQVATVSGLSFSLVLFLIFFVAEKIVARKRNTQKKTHLEEFNLNGTDTITASSLELTSSNRWVVWLKSANSLGPLDVALAELNPETTDLVVLILNSGHKPKPEKLSSHEREILTRVVERSEKAGKPVKPLVLTTNDRYGTIVAVTKSLGANVLFTSAKHRKIASRELAALSSHWLPQREQSVILAVRAFIGSECLQKDFLGGRP